MVEEELDRRQVGTSPRSARPDLLISIFAMGEILATVLAWAYGSWLGYLYQRTGTQYLGMGLHLGISVLRQGLSFPAWWLAMLIPHSRRSIGWPLGLIAILILFYSGKGLSNAIADFYSWTVFGDELWRLWSWRVSQIGLQLVGIGGPCYLLSRVANLHLIRAGDVPQQMPLDTKRLFGLTLVVAIAFAAARWLNVSQTHLSSLSPTDMTMISALSSFTAGISWACLSWAYARHSLLKIIAAIGVLVMLQYVLGIFFYWMWTSKLLMSATEIVEPSLIMSMSASLLSSFGILIAIRIAQYCGYSLVFWKQD